MNTLPSGLPETTKAHSFVSSANEGRVAKIVRAHPFNRAVEVIVFGATKDVSLPKAALQAISNYFIGKFPPYALLGFPPAQFCIAKGKRWTLASSLLTLRVRKELYETLGMIGRPSRFEGREEFIIEIDLSAPWMLPGRPGYERFKSGLEGWSESFDPEVFMWIPGGGAVEWPKGCEMESRQSKVQAFSTRSGGLPELDIDSDDSIRETLEYLSLLSLKADVLSTATDPYICLYQKPPMSHGFSRRYIWMGMLSPKFCQELIETLVADKIECSIAAWGWQDSVVAFTSSRKQPVPSAADREILQPAAETSSEQDSELEELNNAFSTSSKHSLQANNKKRRKKRQKDEHVPDGATGGQNLWSILTPAATRSLSFLLTEVVDYWDSLS